MSASVSLVVTTIRIIQGYSKTDCLKLCKKKKKKNMGETLLVNEKIKEFSWMEKKVLEHVILKLILSF
jgi:hypothetical protein